MRKVLVSAVLCALLSAGCGAGGGVRVTLDEYTISVRPDRFVGDDDAGTVSITAQNVGAIAHQLLVLRTKVRPGDLRVRNGVAQTGKGVDVMGDVPLVAGGSSEVVEFALRPGRYVLICNIAGHYSNGMYASFEVTGGP